MSTIISSPGYNNQKLKYHLRAFDVSLAPWAGKEAAIELVNEPTGWNYEAAVWHDIRITASNGQVD